MVTKWKIWYDDGTTFSSADGTPSQAPLDGIVGIVEWHDDKAQRPYWGSDFYHWTGDGWRAGNQADLERWLRGFCKEVKYGRWIPQTLWDKIISVIKHDAF